MGEENRKAWVIMTNDCPWAVVMDESFIEEAKVKCREAMDKQYGHKTDQYIFIHVHKVQII
jgi:hypothetical protein